MARFVRNGQYFNINSLHVIDEVQFPIGWFHDAANRAAFNVLECAEIPPEFNPLTHKAVETTPVEDNGEWEERWSINELTVEEVAVAVAAARQGISTRRYVEETKGITIGGVPFSTTRESRSNLAAAYAFAVGEEEFEVNWKTPAGTFVTLDSTQIRAGALAVAAHVQACYNREQVLQEAVTNGTYEPEDINTGWPE